jgi:heat shock protein HspQ
MRPVWDQSQFFVGQLVVHRRFQYRGVVVDVDPAFKDTDAWCETVAINRPETDQPWYRILPDGSAHEAYVAQRNLVPDDDGQRIRHPRRAEDSSPACMAVFQGVP